MYNLKVCLLFKVQTETNAFYVFRVKINYGNTFPEEIFLEQNPRNLNSTKDL